MRLLAPLLTAILVMPAASQAPAHWRLVEEWRVGGDADGPHSFDANLGFGRLPTGGFVHYDYKASRLFFLDSLGKVVRTSGRKGQGPGEFGVVNGLAVAPNGNVIVSDLAKGFTIFSGTGTFIRSVRPRVGRAGTGGLWDAVAFRDGSVLENALQPGAGSLAPLRFLWTADLARRDTLQRCGVKEAQGGTTVPLVKAKGGLAIAMPLKFVRAERAAAYDPQGFVWETLDPAKNEIVRHGLTSCQPSAVVRLPGARAALTSSQQRIIAQDARAEAKRWEAAAPDLSRIAPQQAWYRELHVDTQGNLWVERVREDGMLHVEVFAPNGQEIAELADASLALMPLLPIFTATHVYGFVRDGDGVQFLASFRIVR
jgi:hypothetical protein